MFANTSIRALLSWGFAIVILLIAIMSAVIFVRSGTVTSHVDELASDSYPKVAAAAELRLNVMRNWANTLLLAQVSDPESIKRITDEMATNSNVITEKFKFLEKAVASTVGKQKLEAMLKARADYTEMRKKYVDLVKAANREEANRMLTGTLKVKLDAYVNAIGELIVHQSAKMERVSTETLSLTGSLKTINLAVSLLVIAVVAVTGWIVMGVVTRALGGDVQYANQIAHRIAEGRLDVDVRVADDDRDSLLASIKLMRDRLREMVGGISSSAAQLGEASRQLAQASGAVADSSARQSEATSSTAAAVEEMTVGIGQIADSAREAHDQSLQSEELSRKGSSIIHGAAAEMGKIADSVEASSAIIGTLEQQSQEISAVVNVIKEIADQTNLLALNAAIEAARAGEQGRGFAVVADEVRKLAERTTASTQEIAVTIRKIQDGTRDAVQSMVAGVDQVRSGMALAQQAGSSIVEIESGAQRVAGVVNDITSSLREQNAASNEIARNVELIATMVESNNAAAGDAASAAQRLEELADGLARSVGSFRL